MFEMIHKTRVGITRKGAHATDGLSGDDPGGSVCADRLFDGGHFWLHGLGGEF